MDDSMNTPGDDDGDSDPFEVSGPARAVDGSLDDDGAPDLEVVRAVHALWHPVTNPEHKAGRNDVEAVLQRLANGDRFPDDLWFVQELAAALLAAGGKGAPAEDRANNVLRACGLSGKYDHDLEAVRTMQTVRQFGGSISEAIEFARATGDIGQEISDETAKKKLQRGSY